MSDVPMTYGSLFSGAGGFEMGFDAAGMRCLWQVEIDRTARSVLARHWPDVERHEDVRAVGKRSLAPVDVVVGGFPCQDVSTAGKRAGLAGDRSGLFFEMARIVRELRPAYVAWENVPGLLTSDEGRDFLAVLVELDRLGFDGGWRTVDAQYFGVAQQRRRVLGLFARGRSGAERACQILALAEGGRRRTPKGKKARKGVAATLTGGSGGAGKSPPGRRQEDDANLVVGCLQGIGGRSGHRIGADEAAAGHLVVYGGGDTSGERGVCATLTGKAGSRIDFDTENFVLIQDARGVDKGQGGSGVRVSSVSYTLDTRGSEAVCTPCLAGDASPKGRDDGLAYALTARTGRGHGHGMAVCVTGERVTHALTGEGHDAGEDGTGRGVPIVATGPIPEYYSHDYNQDRIYSTAGVSPAVTAQDSSGSRTVFDGVIVRRLTPRECERLQGWPDDWTRYRNDGTEIKDGPRYRMIGNGVPRPFSEWLGRRLVANH